jgi:excisionase family DNA binding protein
MKNTIQSDMFAGQGAKFAELVARRLGEGKDRIYSVGDVAAVLNLGRTKVLEMIECGRLPAANINAGMSRVLDEQRKGAARPLRPLWRVTREALLNLAAEMERGV